MAALTRNQNSTLNSIAVNLLKHYHDIYLPLQHFPTQRIIHERGIHPSLHPYTHTHCHRHPYPHHSLHRPLHRHHPHPAVTVTVTVSLPSLSVTVSVAVTVKICPDSIGTTTRGPLDVGVGVAAAVSELFSGAEVAVAVANSEPSPSEVPLVDGDAAGDSVDDVDSGAVGEFEAGGRAVG